MDLAADTYYSAGPERDFYQHAMRLTRQAEAPLNVADCSRNNFLSTFSLAGRASVHPVPIRRTFMSALEISAEAQRLGARANHLAARRPLPSELLNLAV
jgi:hypothetical protein